MRVLFCCVWYSYVSEFIVSFDVIVIYSYLKHNSKKKKVIPILFNALVRHRVEHCIHGGMLRTNIVFRDGGTT